MTTYDLFGPVPPTFPDPPFSGVTRDTLTASLEAAAKIEPNAETIRAEVLAYIRTSGVKGATDEEIQLALELDGNTERPRRWELAKAELIRAQGHRVNRNGRKCTVWVADRS